MGKGWQNAILVCEGINMQGAHDNTSDLGTDGFLLIGNSSGFAQGALPTSNDGSLTYTAGAGTLDIRVTAPSGSFTWTNIGASQALSANAGYICGSGGAISLSLPASAAVGTIIEVVLSGSASWTITQGAGQRIRIGNTQTTSGVGGSIASTASGDAIRMVCDISGQHWTVLSSIGLITVV